MSNKYILVVKEKYHDSIIMFPKPIDNHQIVRGKVINYDITYGIINDIPSLLTLAEINKLPHGFVQMFNIVEVEDTKYYWRKKKEYLCSFEENDSYLNYNVDDDELSVDSRDDVYMYYQTKFTEQEAKELLGDDFKMFERVDIE